MPDAAPVQLYSQRGRILLQSEYWANRGCPLEKERNLCTMSGQAERAATTYPMPKKKDSIPHIICLHGTACNNQVLENQLRPLTQSWGPKVNLTFIEGHRHITNVFHPTAKEIKQVFNTPNHKEYLETHPCDKEAKLYGMFDSGIHNFELKLKAATDEKGPADALIGFSQGALFATLVAARALKREDAPSPFKCLVLLNPPNPASLKERAPDLFTAPIGIPALICKGATDAVVNCERTWEKGIFDDGPELYRPIFETTEYTSHPDGHQPMPTAASDAETLVREIKAYIKKYCGP